MKIKRIFGISLFFVVAVLSFAICVGAEEPNCEKHCFDVFANSECIYCGFADDGCSEREDGDHYLKARGVTYSPSSTCVRFSCMDCGDSFYSDVSGYYVFEDFADISDCSHDYITFGSAGGVAYYDYHIIGCDVCGLVFHQSHIFVDGRCVACLAEDPGNLIEPTECLHSDVDVSVYSEETHQGRCKACGDYVVVAHSLVDGVCSVCNYGSKPDVKICWDHCFDVFSGFECIYCGFADDGCSEREDGDHYLRARGATYSPSSTSVCFSCMDCGDSFYSDLSDYNVFGIFSDTSVCSHDYIKLESVGGEVSSDAHKIYCDACGLTFYQNHILVDGRCVVCLSIVEDGVSEENDKNDGLLDKIKDSEVSFQRLLGASFGFVFVGVVVYIVYNFVFKGSNERRKKK